MRRAAPAAGLPIRNFLLTDNPVTDTNILNRNIYSAIIGGGTGLTQAVFDALAQENLLTVLAEPNLTASNGQPASFLAGGEFPVPIAGAAATAGGVSTITVEFKKFGVSLDVTPTIIDPDHLSLRIRPEVSQLSNTGAVSVPISANSSVQIPALTVRRAETTVELGSGQTFILAGLLQNTSTQNVSKLPWLGDIPVLGQLFRSERFQRNETELVIMVTPYLVKPLLTAGALPTDGFVAPMTRSGSPTRTPSGPVYRVHQKGRSGPNDRGLVGPVGFRLD